MALQDRIRQAREDMNLGQAEFARALEVSDRAVYYWESGRRKPNSDGLLRLIRVTGKDASYFDERTEAVA